MSAPMHKVKDIYEIETKRFSLIQLSINAYSYTKKALPKVHATKSTRFRE